MTASQKLQMLKGSKKVDDTMTTESHQLTGAVWYLFDWVVKMLNLSAAQAQLLRPGFETLNAAVTDKTEDWNKVLVSLIDDLQQSGLAIDKMESLLHRLRRDGRTLLYRREFGEERLLITLLDDHRGNGFGIEMVDHDRFKAYNDAYGHLVGDLILSTTGQLFRMHNREGDIGVRWGGDEYLRIVYNLFTETQLGLVGGRDTEAVESFNWQDLNPAFSEGAPRLSIGLVYCEKPTGEERKRMKEIDSAVVLTQEQWFNIHIPVPPGSTYDIGRQLVAKVDEQLYKSKREQRGPEQKNVRIVNGSLVEY